MFSLEFESPTGALKQFVSLFYRFETTGDAMQSDFERADIPHCRFYVGQQPTLAFGTAPAVDVPAAALIGPRNKFSILGTSGTGYMIGFGLLPAGWVALAGASAGQYADKVVDAASLMGPIARDIHAEIAKGGTLAETVARIAPLIEDACLRVDNIPLWFLDATTQWLRSSLNPDIDDLVAATGLTRHRTETMIRDLFGASPKLFIRKSRAIRVANRIAHGEGDWQDYIEDGFCDQSHCIREIKHFTGVTPAMIRDGRTNMKRTQFQRRREPPKVVKG